MHITLQSLKLDQDAMSQRISAIILSLWHNLWHYTSYRSTHPLDLISTTDSARDSTSPTEKQYSPSINGKIERLLKAGPNLQKTKDKDGYVYVLVGNHNGIPIVKVGHTTAADARPKKQQLTCRVLQFQPQIDVFPVRSYYKLVEKLVHEELHDHCQLVFCSCRTRHRQVFAVDPEVVRGVIRRWIRFCEKEPWRFAADPATGCRGIGTLKKYWRNRLDHRRDRIYVHSRQGPTDNIEGRLALWDGFVNHGFGETLREYTPLVLLSLALVSFCAFSFWADQVSVALKVLPRLIVVSLYAGWRGYDGLRDCLIDSLPLSLILSYAFCVW
ncbi:hypothetical protein N657DRAFT_632860 [Parathielavia appendiculata]|uniref:Bacteriophage T5 Orf172 DNA-binding domain-containing protein n=1 Tax=Parathielavia appendiculata TaxID=2587402 RepID=A0AAN6Z449_9PEZI|nr:hypothetical protein N657DRAFT_632860 [Parathielavia appendiculata]